jgi:chemotaxis signal transduction protein
VSASAILDELRRAFDAAFAAAPTGARRLEVPLLALRAGGEPLAVRALETAGLQRLPRVVPLPSRRPEVLGVTGWRGAVLPVYALSRLMGLPDGTEPPRWMLLCGEERLALAFTAFEAHVQVAPEALQPAARGAARPAVRELVHLDGQVRSVVSIPDLLMAIHRP